MKELNPNQVLGVTFKTEDRARRVRNMVYISALIFGVLAIMSSVNRKVGLWKGIGNYLLGTIWGTALGLGIGSALTKDKIVEKQA